MLFAERRDYMAKSKTQSQLCKPTERFCCIEKLGGGGNGIVYRVYDKKTSQEVALKQLKRRGDEREHRFVAEIQVMEKFAESIDGIIPILDSAPQEFWYTMPVAKTIMKYIEEAQCTSEEIVRGIIQISETLLQLHEKGISHRDIKPQNILFYNSRYYLSDFGLVSIPESPDHFTRADKGLGAIFTIAPEMKRYPKHADGKKADVFSLAKTLWMLLTGNDQGFDGVYNSFDKSHSLRYIDKLANTHLVELEDLLAISTDNDPSVRPDMLAFHDKLVNWLEITKDHSRTQISEWNFINKYLFRDNMPESAVWSDKETIIRILNEVGTLKVFNHMFLPDGGGLDFKFAESAVETGCICIYDTLNFAHIVKPERLYFETFGKDQAWSYFFLELSSIEPILPDSLFSDSVEFLEEDTPGHYVSSRDSVYEVYDYDTGEPLPEGHRGVSRYLKGNILIVLKDSPYNGIPQTYDGRHSQCNNRKFRKYMEYLRDIFNRFIALGYSENRILSAIGQSPFKEEREVVLATETPKKVPRAFIEKNFLSWSFQEFLKPSGEGNIAFSFSFQIQNGGTMSEILQNKGFYLCTDGMIRKNPPDDSIYRIHDRDEAVRLKALCDKQICTLCENEGFNHPSIYETCFDICLKRSGKPTHLFTKEEIEDLMRAADDRQRNVLVIDEHGNAKMIQDSVRAFLYPVRHEAWEPRNNYVGKYSPLSTLDDVYLGSLQGWLSYLKTDHRVYLDYIRPDMDISSLITEINGFY